MLLMALVACGSSNVPAAPPPINWTETVGIQWCSDGKSPDWIGYPKDPFGAGVDGGDCPRTPAAWPLQKVVAACEKLCTPAGACLGFTLYPSHAQVGLGRIVAHRFLLPFIHFIPEISLTT